MNNLSLLLRSLERVKLLVGNKDTRKWIWNSSGQFSVKSLLESFFPDDSYPTFFC